MGKKKPSFAIVGPGRLGAALAFALREADFTIDEIVARDERGSLRRATRVARELRTAASTMSNASLRAAVIWLCVSDTAIRSCAELLSKKHLVDGKTVFHSSGALSSDELTALRNRGAHVASVHPMMSFVQGSRPSLAGVTFALEGDQAALRVARRIVRELKGEVITVAKRDKPLYHAWGAFASPLIIAELATADSIAIALGIPAAKARKTLAPILRQTIENYIANGPAAAFSGPIVRGDVETVRKHLRVLKSAPDAREVYLRLARVAVRRLPAGKKDELAKLLGLGTKKFGTQLAGLLRGD